MKSDMAIKITYDAIYDMFEMMSPELSPPVNASATLPIIRATEGRMAPARIEDSVPMKSNSLSYIVM